MTAIRDDVNSSAIIGAGFGTAFLVVFLVLAITSWFLKLQTAEASRKSGVPPALELYRAEQGAKLTGYGWVDQANGKVRIPIERAMEITLRELATPAPAAEATPSE